MPEFERYYSAAEIARRWDVDVRVVRDLLAKGELRGFKPGHNWRIPPQAVRDYEHDACKPPIRIPKRTGRRIVTRIEA